jgi:hypothetical protein
MSFLKNGVSESFSGTQTATMSIAGYKVQSPVIGTAVYQISTATISALGYAFMRSLVTTTQATCTITFGRWDGAAIQPVVRMRPGEQAVMRLAPGSYALQGAAEGYKALVAIFEE